MVAREVPPIDGARRSETRAEAARATMSALVRSRDDVFETFFVQLGLGLALADLSSRYVRVNEAYAELVGRASEDLVGVPFRDVVHPDDRSAEFLRTEVLLTGAASALTAEERYVRADGSTTWVLHGVTVVADAEGRPAWFAVTAQDITERRRAESELRELTETLAAQAVRDPLTGLANRTLLEERLRKALSRDGRSGGTTGLLFLDLDGFKTVNDEHGHAVGDEVLKVVAGRLLTAVRPSDTVARLGGDEFVVLAEGAVTGGLEALADRLRDAVAQPVRVGTLDLEVGVSVGVAASDAGRSSPSALLEEADRRMYGRKAGRTSRPTSGAQRGDTRAPG